MGISLIGISHHNTPLAVPGIVCFSGRTAAGTDERNDRERHRRRMRDYQYL